MEGAPQKSEDNIERLADWREIKEQAPEAAEERIAYIEGFVDMESAEQIVALKELLNELNEDNANRFVADVVAHRISYLTAIERNAVEMDRLGVA